MMGPFGDRTRTVRRGFSGQLVPPAGFAYNCLRPDIDSSRKSKPLG